jgi:hypothetical protein
MRFEKCIAEIMQQHFSHFLKLGAKTQRQIATPKSQRGCSFDSPSRLTRIRLPSIIPQKRFFFLHRRNLAEVKNSAKRHNTEIIASNFSANNQSRICTECEAIGKKNLRTDFFAKSANEDVLIEMLTFVIKKFLRSLKNRFFIEPG